MTIMTNVNLTTICWVLSPLQHWLGWKSALFFFSPNSSQINDGWFLRNEKTTVPSITQLRLKTLEAEAVWMDFSIPSYKSVLYICCLWLELTWLKALPFIAKHRSSTVQCFSNFCGHCRCSCNHRCQLSRGLAHAALPGLWVDPTRAVNCYTSPRLALPCSACFHLPQ